MLRALVFVSITFVLTFVVSMIVAFIIQIIGKVVQKKPKAVDPKSVPAQVAPNAKGGA